MHNLNQQKVALAVGTTAALLHVIWSILVVIDWAEPFLAFVLNLHFLDNPYLMEPFDLGKSLVLIVLSFIVWYVIGYVFATIWNRFHRA